MFLADEVFKSYSVFNEGEFNDESFAVPHDQPGLLGMCHRNDYANTNECMFYVTTGAPLSFMDKKNVVFGRVISGLRVFKLMEKVQCVNQEPKQSLKIVASGVVYIESEAEKLTK